MLCLIISTLNSYIRNLSPFSAVPGGKGLWGKVEVMNIQHQPIWVRLSSLWKTAGRGLILSLPLASRLCEDRVLLTMVAAASKNPSQKKTITLPRPLTFASRIVRKTPFFIISQILVFCGSRKNGLRLPQHLHRTVHGSFTCKSQKLGKKEKKNRCLSAAMNIKL